MPMVFFTTVDDKEKARKIAKELVTNKLAACVSIMPIESTYFWEGELWEGDQEYLLIIKTLEEKKESLIEWLKKNHPYKVPEIISLPAEAYGKYLEWMKETLLKK